MSLRFFVLMTLLLAFVLRVHGLDSMPFSRDEKHTFQEFISLSISEIFTMYHSNNSPLPSALAHLFSPNSNNLFMMRWPMLLVGMLSLPFIYRLGADLFGRSVGLVALLLMAFSTTHIGYSVAVRGYIGLIALTTASLWFLVRAVKFNRWSDWLGFLAVNVLEVYFHLFGVLAAWTQVGLVGLWLLYRVWTVYPASGWRQRCKSVLFHSGSIVLLLAAAHAWLIYARTRSVLAESGNFGDFDIWRNGIFSLHEELFPFIDLARYMMPVSPMNIGLFLFALFFALGLIFLWQRHYGMVILAAIWFISPFLVIFTGLRILSSFYAYTRFLLYLLPAMFLIIALGMVASVEWLWLSHDRPSYRAWQYGKRALVILIIVAMAVLLFFSSHWHLQASAHTSWQRIAQVVAKNFQPGDIAICEEGQGFNTPDRPHAYCIWMLDLIVPDLKEDSPQLWNSTSTIANFNELYRQRESLSRPGDVWLVLWQKIQYWPGEYEATRSPVISPPPLLSAFEPYRAWHFGSAALVRVDSETTLLGNLHRTLELLAQLDETSLADKARFYRSLAELEAVQGHKAAAQAYYDQSWAAVNQAGGQYPELFLFDTLPLIKRIPSNEPLMGVEKELVKVHFDQSLCLSGFQVSSEVANPGQNVEMALHWQVQDFVAKDYVYYFSLYNQAGENVGRLEGDPFQRVYPTTWWWPGEQMVDRITLTVPPDLVGQNYVVSLELAERSSGESERGSSLFQLRWLGGHWVFETQDTPQPGCNGE